MSSPFLLILLVVFSGFLGLLVLLALAVTKTVNPDGRATRGVLGGCAAALAICFVCGLGAIGLGTFVVAAAVGTAVDKNPIERIEVHRHHAGETGDTAGNAPEFDDLEHFPNDDKVGPVHLLFTMKGDAGRQLVDLVKDVVHLDHGRIEDYVQIQDRTGSVGSEFQIVEFTLPIGEEDLNELEHDIRHELDGMEIELPDSVVIEFEGAKRFY